MTHRGFRRALAAVFGLALLATCSDSPTGGGRPGVGTLALASRLTPRAAEAARTLAALEVEIDNIRLRLTRAGAGTPFLDTTVAFPAGSDTLRLVLSFPVRSGGEPIGALLEHRAGETVMFSGELTVTVAPGANPPTPPVVDVDYTGPGATATSLTIAPRDTALDAAAGLTLSAVARDQGGAALAGTPIEWSVSDTALGGISATGQFTGKGKRGVLHVVARTPTNVRDSIRLTLRPAPTAIEAVSGSGQSGTVGQPLASPFVARVLAADLLPVGGVWVKFAVVAGNGSIAPDSVLTDTLGRATALATLGSAPGAHQFSATVTGVGTVSFSATANAGAPASLEASSGDGQAAAAGSAVAVPPAVIVKDAFGNRVPGAAVVFAPSGNGQVTGSPATADAQGVATVGSWTLATSAGANTLTATATGTNTIVFNATGTAAAPASMHVAGGDGQSATAGTAVATPPSVVVRDAFGNGVAGVTVTFTAAPNGSVTGSPAVTDASGVATVGSWTLGTSVGTGTLTATAAGVDPVVFSATVLPGSPSVLSVSQGSGQQANAGSLVAVAPVIQVRDAHGNAVPGVQVTFTPTGDGQVTGSPATTDAGGEAAVGSWRLATTAGTNTLTASVAGAGSINVIATGVAGPAASVAVHAGNAQTATVGTTVAVAPAVRVTDAHGNVVAGVAVTFTPSGSGTVSGSPAGSNASGIATVGSWTLGTTAGAQQLVATVGSDSVIFTATATAGAPATMTVAGGGGQTAVAGATVATAPSVRVRDAHGNLVPGVAVAFAASGDGSVTGSPATTNASGVATVGSWTLATAKGANTLTATAGAATATISATGVAGPAAIVTVQQGDGQSGRAGTALPIAPAVSVTDQHGNPVAGVSVAWSVTTGSIANATSTTGSGGLAYGGTWRLGPATGPQQLVATVASVGSVTFTATASQPQVVLTLLGTDKVALGRKASVEVLLGEPALAGGATVTLASSNTSRLTVSPVSLSFAAGESVDTVEVDGVGAGAVNLVASSSQYLPDTLPIVVELRALSMPQSVSVPYQTTASVPITLANPAGANGLTVTVTSADTSVVLVQTPTVVVPAGATTASAIVEGRRPGSALLRAGAPQYDSASTTATVSAALNILNASATINASFGSTQTVRFQSNGVAVAAPPGGLKVALASTVPACVVVPDTVLIPAGVVQANFPIAYPDSGGAPLSCTTRVRATAPDIVSDSMTVTVNPTPNITLGTNGPVGAGLMRARTLTLGSSIHGGVTVTVKSLRPGVLLLAPNVATAGADSFTVFIPNGSTSSTFYMHGVEDVADTARFSVTAPGFNGITSLVTVKKPAFQLSGIAASTIDTFDPRDDFYVTIGIAATDTSTSLSEAQARRAGLAPLSVTFAVSDTVPLQLMTSTDTAGVVTRAIQPGQSTTPTSIGAGGVAILPRAEGVDTISAAIPGFFNPTKSSIRAITVTQPRLTTTGTVVGVNLQTSRTISLSAPAPAGTQITLRSQDSTRLLVSPNATTPGQGAVVLSVGTGAVSVGYHVQGLAEAAQGVIVSVESPGFAADTASIQVNPSAVDLQGVPTTINPGDPDAAFRARVGWVAATGTTITSQPLRAGLTGVQATVTLSDTTGVVLVDASGIRGLTDVVGLNPGASETPSTVAAGGVALRAVGTDTATVSVTIPGFRTVPTSSRTVIVVMPTITTTATNVGERLMTSRTLTLGAAQHGGDTIRVTSADPTRLRVSRSATEAGAAFVDIPVANGATTATYFVHGTGGGTGAVTVSLTSRLNKFSAGSATMNVFPALVQITALATVTPTSLSLNDPFQLQVGIPSSLTGTSISVSQAISASLDSVAFTIVSDTPNVARLVTDNGGIGGSVTVYIRKGSTLSPSSRAAGGVELDPLTVGTTRLVASAPGFTTGVAGAVVIQVNNARINQPNAVKVGGGLMIAANFSLNATDHGGVVVTIVSSNPNLMLFGRSTADTLPNDTITVAVANGSSSGTFYIHGLEGQEGTPTFTLSAPGFIGTSQVATVLPAGIVITGLLTQLDSSAHAVTGSTGDPFQVQTGYVDGTTFGPQPIRAGRPALTATVASSTGNVTLAKAGGVYGSPMSVQVAAGTSLSPSTIAGGGIGARALAAGTARISVTAPGYISTLPNSQIEVTVVP